MNAITRVQQHIRLNPFAGVVLQGKQLALVLLFFCVFASAVGVVYMKDLNRRLFIQYQGLLQQRQQYNVEWGELLLEQNTWATQSRVARIARKHNMVTPRNHSVNLI